MGLTGSPRTLSCILTRVPACLPCYLSACPPACQTGLSAHLIEIIALILLPVAIAMCGYAIFVFVWRSDMISKKRVRVVTALSRCSLCCFPGCLAVSGAPQCLCCDARGTFLRA